MDLKQYKNEAGRYIVDIHGIVQGVGFRPFVYHSARELKLCGYVSNIGGSVFIDVEGEVISMKHFINKIMKTPPPLAQIEKINIRKAKMKGYDCFDIVKSSEDKEELRFIPKDTAICNSCKKDILENSGRWFHYEFTNCTDCGPRYSIIKELPYDRCSTSMRSFEMCPACKEEYENPDSRRFHAQPVCCPICGPQLKLLDCKGKEIVAQSAIREAVRLLKEGSILAVKGVGGFHLMCDAENQKAVAKLRSRKQRPHQPLAVMAADAAAIENQCVLNDRERQLITSSQSPIVLLKKKATCSLPNILAWDSDKLGMLLPYTPMHMLIFADGLKYLVATSANLSGMPMEYENQKAIDHLSEVTDYFLLHDREINIPIDDSVTKVFIEKEVISRVGRGYAPLSINIGAQHQLAALGAEQKSGVCLSKNGYTHVSQYLGDMKSPEAFENYKKVLDHLIHLLRIKPQAYVHDLHPGYLSTQYALEQQGMKLALQHHFAHMASCMAEHKLTKPAIGVIYDGTGFGEDGKIWGGEILVGNLKGVTRAGHLKYCAIQGGDKAVEEPWRSAVSYLYALGDCSLEGLAGLDNGVTETVKAALKAGLHCFESSSMGRLFDCVSALLGLCSKTTYDAQAAIILEHVADRQIQSGYEYEIQEDQDGLLIGYEEIIKAILTDIRKGKGVTEISCKFHNTIADATVEAVVKVGKLYGVREAVLSGGCFENLLLLEKSIKKLEGHGFTVYYNEKLPCNDGGISFGQLAAADRIMRG
jgi:hydrogenase maturation protein HypF